jgi:DNA modification methylase
MTDEEALRELLLSNTEKELEPLEIGLHVLKCVGGERSNGGRGKKGGIAEYARKMGKSSISYQQYVEAARVALVAKPHKHLLGLIDYTIALHIIHSAPGADWAALVEAMLAGKWNNLTTEQRVAAVKEFEIPEDLSDIFPREVVIARYLDGAEFAPSTLAKLVEVIRRIENAITAHSDIDVTTVLAEWRAWLRDGGPALWDVRKLTKRLREILTELEAAEIEAARRWNLGDWRQHVEALADESVALVLTDPPYGIDFQSDFRLDRSQPHRHEQIENDGTAAAVAEIEECMRALYPKLAPSAHALCFCHWRNEPDVRAAIERAGYEIRGSLIWVKNNTGMGDPTTTFAPKHERIIHAVKGSPILFRRVADVLESPRVSSDLHPTEKPVRLLRELIDATTVEGEIVADPFGGVASTLVAAKAAKRQYWGCELNPEYFAAGTARLTSMTQPEAA